MVDTTLHLPRCGLIFTLLWGLFFTSMLPANEQAVFSHSLSLGQAEEEGSSTRWFFTGLAADGEAPLFGETESPAMLLFSGELFPVTLGQAQYRSAFVEIADGIGIVEHGVLDITIADWAQTGTFPDFLRIDQVGDFTAQGTWTPTLTSGAPSDVRMVFERTSGERQGTYRIEFLANTSGGIAVLGDPAHHYAGPESADGTSSWDDSVGNQDFSLSAAVDAVEVTSGFEAIPFAYQLVAPYGATEGGEAESFDSSFSGATGSVEVWFQQDFASIPAGQKQVVFETGGNANGLSLLAEKSAEGDPLLRILQSEDTARNLDVTLNLAGEAGYTGLGELELADFVQCVLRFDGAAEQLRILINGTVAKTVSTNGLTSLSGGNDAALFFTSGDIDNHLGGRGGEAGYDAQIAQFTGKIADLRIYATALGTDDAQGNFNAMQNPGVTRTIDGTFTLPRISVDGASTATGGNSGLLALGGTVEDGGGSAGLTGSADYTLEPVRLSGLQMDRDDASGTGPSSATAEVVLSLSGGSYHGDVAVNDGNGATEWADYRHFYIELPASAPTIIAGPTGAETTAGEMLELSVEVEGLFVAYQWLLDGEAIPGADSPTYQVAHSGSADAGDYTVHVETGIGQSESDTAVASILPPIIHPTLSPDETQSGTFLLRWNSFPGQTYQVRESSNLNRWDDVGDVIDGTGSSLEKSFNVPPETTSYFFRIHTTY